MDRRLPIRRISFVVPPQVHMLDLGGPLQLFASVNELGLAALPLRVVGPQARPMSFQGLRLADLEPLPARLDAGEVIVVIGCKLDERARPTPAQQRIVEWLREVVAPRREHLTIASVCTGALLLGEAGLLDARECTTHHDYLAALQRLCPRARVLDKRLLVDDGNVLTSAGVAAGIDLALHLIARHFGPALAVRVARDNVVPFRRLEADPALDVRLQFRSHDSALIHAVQDYLSEHSANAPPYGTLASRFGVSYRHLARCFRDACGITLKAYHQQLRLGMAERMLEQSDWSIERIAEHCGFATPQAFRAAWRQQHDVAPRTWRNTCARLVR